MDKTDVIIDAEARNEIAAAERLAELAPIIKTDAEYEAAGEQITAIATQAKSLEGRRKALVAPVLEAQRRINDLFRDPIEFCKDARKRLDDAMGAYEDKKKAEREAAERAAAEAARKERERMQRDAAAAEQKAREHRARDDEKARKLEEAGKAERAEAAREVAAQRERERLEAAEDARAAAMAMPAAPVVHIAPPKVKGVSARMVWEFEITDESKVPRAYLMTDNVKIRRVVKAMGADADIPGVTVFQRRVSTAHTK